MSLLTTIRDLLNRPIAPQPVPDRPSKGRAAAGPEPVTEAELVEALEQLEQQRAAARRTIVEAGDRRERLLEQDASDAEIHALDAEVSAANLTLERLERVGPDLSNRLQDLRDGLAVARFAALRDAVVSAGRAYVDQMRAWQPTQGPDYFAALETFMAEHRDAPLPRAPFLGEADIAAFEAQLKGFARTIFHPRPSPPPHPILAERLKQPGADVGQAAATWGANAVMGTRPAVDIRLTRAWCDEQGGWHKPREVIRRSGAEAEVMLRAGAAELVDATEAVR